MAAIGIFEERAMGAVVRFITLFFTVIAFATPPASAQQYPPPSQPYPAQQYPAQQYPAQQYPPPPPQAAPAPPPSGGDFAPGEIVNAGHQFFGSAARGLASIVEKAVSQWG